MEPPPCARLWRVRGLPNAKSRPAATLATPETHGYSNRIFARRMTSPHFTRSAVVCAANSSGVPSGSEAPCDTNRWRERLTRLDVNPIDDLARRAGGSEQAEPCAALHLGVASLGHGRHVREH